MQLCRSVAGCQLQCVQCSRVALVAGIGCRHQVAAPLERALSVCALRSPFVRAGACTRAVTWQSSGRGQQLSTKATTASADPAVATRKLCLIDGHNLAFRAYYGIFKNPMSALQVCVSLNPEAEANCSCPACDKCVRICRLMMTSQPL
jgi:hypothetical protein